MMSALRLHAIYLSLSDAPFFEASVRSIYDHVDAITVTTTYDRDWKGRRRAPDDLISLVLERNFDPDRKIDLIVGCESSEARARNRAMDHADPHGRSRRVARQHAVDLGRPPVDYFLVIDPDEIYEAGALARLAAHAARRRLPVYRVPAVRYFKRWTYRVDGHEWSTALIRADTRLHHLRNIAAPVWRRAGARAPLIAASARDRLRRWEDIPPEVAVFHHGSYVGPRQRIVDKLGSFGHADEVAQDWITGVWDQWTPESRDFNPAWPDLYPSARRVTLADLPPEIVDFPWPDEYLT